MSQCYRIQLKSSISHTVEAEDSVCYPIELTNILPAQEMSDLLADALRQQGWLADGGNERVFRKTGPTGESLSVDLDALTVTARVARQSEVSVEVEVTGRGESEKLAAEHAQQALRERSDSLQGQLTEAGERSLRQEVRQILEAGEAARRQDLHGLLQQVYGEALKRKAGQLGTVMEIQESTSPTGDYELTIRVEA